MRNRVLKVSACAFACACLTVFAPARAAPQYIPISERVRESPVIIVARVVKHLKKKRSKRPGRYILKLLLETRDTLKGKAPKKFRLPLIIEPRGYGNYLPEPPPPGIYIMFLIRGKSTKAENPAKATNKKPGNRKAPGPLLPYAPQNFFYLIYNQKNMRAVTLHLLK